MRIERPREAQRLGANLIYGVQKVYELDSGPLSENSYEPFFVIRQVPYEALYEIEKQMAIIVPIKSERLRLIEGVLYGIPHSCLTIVVSNSPREPVDRFNMEKNAIENFNTFSNKQVLVVHQKDPVMGQAFADAGYSEILDQDGYVADGKAEGMIIGILLARLAGKKYVGFIDADNYFPGAVFEYVRIYASGFALSQSNYSMVRNLWHSKPKIVDSNLYFAKYGRTSIVTNQYLNRLVSYHTGFETDVIKTGNAGEHALSMELALLLDYASGYAIEPYHYINLIEKFGGLTDSPYQEVMRQSVEVYQVESRNPHLHASKGEPHIQDMIGSSLRALYHSLACPHTLKQEIVHEMRRRHLLTKEQVPEPITRYSNLLEVRMDSFAGALCSQAYDVLFQAVTS
jgi:mannosyl-3-phosphoglycerate synthase